MAVITQVSKIQYRKQDGSFFIYLWREYRDVWMKLREKGIRVVVRIEIPDHLLENEEGQGSV